MAVVEKYIPTRINLDVSPEAVHRSGERKFLPGDLLDAVNVRYYPTGRVRHIKGNAIRPYALPSGINTVIGCFVYEKFNTFIYHIHNSFGNHQMVEYNPQTEIFTPLLQGSSLNYSLSHYINQGKIIDDLHVFNDAFNPIRCVNIVRAKAGGYTAPYGYKITLAAKPPLIAPTFSIVTDGTVPLNYVTQDTWQFTYQFTYIDDRKSTFGPLSKLAYIRLEDKITDTTNNAIDVTVNIPAEILEVIKQVDVVFRAGNFGNYYIFETIRNPTLTSYTVRFTNKGKASPVSLTDQTRLYDAIPAVSEALEIVKNKVFTPINNVGFDIDESTFNFNVTIGQENHIEGKRYAKDGGNYGVGILFMDDFGRTSFVKKDQYHGVPFTVFNGTVGVRPENRKFFNWSISGTPPPGMTKYQIVLTVNKFQATYVQTVVVPHLYVREMEESETEGTVDGDHYFWQGKKFRKYTPTNIDHPPYYTSVYLQIPLNLPFVPDTSCLVRFSKDGFPFTTVPILDVRGEFIVIDLLYTDPPSPTDIRDQGTIVDWSQHPKLLVEIFRPSQEVDDRFFEVSEIFDITAGAFTVSSGKVYGETYKFKHPGYLYTPVLLTNYNEETGDIPQVPNTKNVYTPIIESPSGILSQSIVGVPENVYSIRRGSRGSEIEGGSAGSIVATGDIVTNKTVYAVNYNKAASDYGRVHTIFTDEKKRNLNTTIGYSESYVQNTYINGLNTFLANNQYPLEVDRGPLRGFKKAGNVLVAVHERKTSTLYIGEGHIKTGARFILSKTDDVIGDDRELGGDYGTINPESLLEANGHVFFWDVFRGAVVRYTNTGLFPISAFGMWEYFINKGKQLLPYKDISKVITAFDYVNDEFIITFCPILNETGGVLVPGETWAFNVKETVKAWVQRFDFIPECYGHSNTDLISFKEGALWHHGKNTLFNNFYGVQYPSKWKFVCNPWPGRNKRYYAVHIKGNLTQNLTSEFQVVKVKTQEGQESYIPAYEFELNEGKYVGSILKDIHTPVDGGKLALRSGDDLISNYLEVEIINDRTDEGNCAHVNVVFETQNYSI